MTDFFLILLGLAIVILSFVLIHVYAEILRVKRELHDWEQKIKKEYVKLDYRIKNAVLEACEYAEKEERDIDIKNFNNLLEELRGK